MGALLLTLGSLGCMFIADVRYRRKQKYAKDLVILAEADEEALKVKEKAKKEAEEKEAKNVKELQDKVRKQGTALYQAIKLEYELSDRSRTLVQMFNDRMPEAVQKFMDAKNRLPSIIDYKRVSVKALVFSEALGKCLGGGPKRSKKRSNSNTSLIQ